MTFIGTLRLIRCHCKDARIGDIMTWDVDVQCTRVATRVLKR